MKIIKNAIQCKKCGDIIESVSEHDFKTCSCGACSIDGGKYYLKRCSMSLDDFIELSEYQEQQNTVVPAFSVLFAVRTDC